MVPQPGGLIHDCRVQQFRWLLRCDDGFLVGLLGLGLWIQLMAYIIPIPLTVTLEMVKLFNGKLMDWDNGMYDDSMKQYAECRTTSVLSDLGQVEIILSDKTGT